MVKCYKSTVEERLTSIFQVLIGGNPDGVKFLLTNKDHHGITNGFVIKGQPALNTAHYSHAYETLTRITESIKTSDGHIPGWVVRALLC